MRTFLCLFMFVFMILSKATVIFYRPIYWPLMPLFSAYRLIFAVTVCLIVKNFQTTDNWVIIFILLICLYVYCHVLLGSLFLLWNKGQGLPSQHRSLLLPVLAPPGGSFCYETVKVLRCEMVSTVF